MLSPSAANDVARLSIIEEDDVPQPRSPRASHRPFNRRWKDDPPRHSFEASPPEYNVWDTEGPKGERLFDLRNHKHIARRGGWKRLLLIILVIVAALIALAVGLGVGLTRKNVNNSSSSPAVANPTPTPAPFPAGSYSLPVYLTAMSSNCTSNSATWRCYPFSTYSSSGNQSLVKFNWIISSLGSSKDYTITAADNPFTIPFANISLNLLDSGSGYERYHFSLPYDQASSPDPPITSDGSQSRCFFNRTTFEADLYSHKAPENVSTGSNMKATDGYQDWPYAVEVTQSIGGGQDVPNCYQLSNGDIGTRITGGLEPRSAQDQCECIWKNYEL